MLVHDLLLAKKGIAAPSSHPLRTAVTKHKARLGAELTKARLRRGLASLEALREHVNTSKEGNGPSVDAQAKTRQPEVTSWSHPRWVRINTIRSTLGEQLATTFAEYRQVARLEEIVDSVPRDSSSPILHVDKHIPNLVALPSGTDFAGSAAYNKGLIILQDKASCFPAYLLDPRTESADYLDACAAPGNKTTHLAAIILAREINEACPTIWACERDKARAVVLQTMVERAGAKSNVKVRAGQDFLRLDPEKEPWHGVGALLLDPSCSGSGIVGRDDMPPLVLPEKNMGFVDNRNSKKRKRDGVDIPVPAPEHLAEPDEEVPLAHDQSVDKLRGRLEALSAFQLKLLLHAFRFPRAKKVIYSTCSIHAEENEHVVIRALNSPLALQSGWRILRRDEQVSGMKAWDVRGHIGECGGLLPGSIHTSEEISEACIRCNKGTKEGTQGFFVVGFVRDYVEPTVAEPDRGRITLISSSHGSSTEEVWEGFSDEGSTVGMAPDRQQSEHHVDGSVLIAKPAKSKY